MIPDERFKALLKLYIKDSISPAESADLFSLIDSGEFDEILKDHFHTNLLNADAIKGNDLALDKAREIMMNILAAKRSDKPHTAVVVHFNRTKWAVAVITAVIFGLSIFIWKKNDLNTFQALIPKGTTGTTNNSNKDLLLKMEDGSSVTLHPGAVIHYPAHFLANKREIYLEGEAFFQVSKNPARPFLVYNSRTITQVLGTSFTIKENKQKGEIEVTVRTGKVMLHENADLLSDDAEQSKGVVITPNQKVTYNKSNRRFEATLVDHPIILTGDSTSGSLPDFNFERTTLTSVLKTLQEAYGIEIVVNNENIYQCTFTGDISRPDFFNKLSIITQSVKASYTIKGTKILIEGKGCR